VITDEATAREKDRLPGGWGRFGKAIDRLPALTAEDETLLATCVGLNPTFKHRSVTLPGGLAESAKKEVTLRWPEGEMHVKGCAKQMLPALVAALGGASAPR
jgi:hypothetical protein